MIYRKDVCQFLILLLLPVQLNAQFSRIPIQKQIKLLPTNNEIGVVSNFGTFMQSVEMGGSIMQDPYSPTAFLVNPALAGFQSSFRTSVQYGTHDDDTQMGLLCISGPHFGIATSGFRGSDRIPFLDKQYLGVELPSKDGLQGVLTFGTHIASWLSFGFNVKPFITRNRTFTYLRPVVGAILKSETVERINLESETYAASTDVGIHLDLGGRGEIGGVVQNVGSASTTKTHAGSEVETHGVTSETIYKAGAALTPFQFIRIIGDWEYAHSKQNYRLGLSFQFPAIPIGDGIPITIWGTSYRGDRYLTTEYKEQNAFGIRFKILGHQFSYAWVDEPGFSTTHMAMMSVDLKPKKKLEKVENVEAQLAQGRNGLNAALLGIRSLRKQEALKESLKDQKTSKKSVRDLIDRRPAFMDEEVSDEKEQDVATEEEVAEETLSEVIPFPENYYTYKSLYHTANEFKMIADELLIQMKVAQEDEGWGFRATPEAWNAPGVKDYKDWLLHRADYGEGTNTIRRSLIDMDGDDLPDYVVSDPHNDYNRYYNRPGSKGWAVFYNTGGGFKTDEIWTWNNDVSILPNGNVGDITRTRNVGQTYQNVIDINGDGYPDYVLADYSGRGSSKDKWKVALNQIPINEKKEFGRFQDWDAEFEQPYLTNWSSIFYDVGFGTTSHITEMGTALLAETFDLTGDTIPDYVIYRHEGERIWWDVYPGQKKGGFKGENDKIEWVFEGLTDNGFTADWIHKKAYSITNPGVICLVEIKIGTYGIYDGKNVTEATKDMNGDGQPDHIFSSPEGILYVAINNGSGFEEPVEWAAPSKKYMGEISRGDKLLKMVGAFASTSPLDYTVVRKVKSDLVDIDGDGDADWVEATSGSEGWSVFLNNGSGFGPLTVFSVDPEIEAIHQSELGKWNSWGGIRKRIWLLDMNGDENPDLIDTRDSRESGVWKVYINKNPKREDLENFTEERSVRLIQAALAEGHEAFFHEEYALSLRAYDQANALIVGYLGVDAELPAEKSEESSAVGEEQAEPELSAFQSENKKVLESLWRIEKSKIALPQKTSDSNNQVMRFRPSKSQVAGQSVQNQMQAERAQSFTKTLGPEMNVDLSFTSRLNRYKWMYCDRRKKARLLEGITLQKEDCDSTGRFIKQLPYIRNFVIPLCLGDTHMELGNYALAEYYYTVAAKYECLNSHIETKVLWLKYATLYLRQADDFYKISYRHVDEVALRDSAFSYYDRVLESDFPMFATERSSDDSEDRGKMANLFGDMSGWASLIGASIDSLENRVEKILNKAYEEKKESVLQSVNGKLKDLSLTQVETTETLFEEINALVLVKQMEAWINVMKLENGLNYLGISEAMLPIWRYGYLLSLARNYCQYAIQLEKEYMNYKVSAENETYSQQQMIQSISLGQFNQLIGQYKSDQAAWQTAISKINDKIAEIQTKAAKAQLDVLKKQQNNAFLNGVISTAIGVVKNAKPSKRPGESLPPGVMGPPEPPKTNWGKMGLSMATSAASSIFSAIQGNAELGNQIEQARYAYQQAQLAEKVAGLQITISQIGQQISTLEKDMAALQLQYTQKNLEFMQNKEFNAELWFKLASSVKELSEQHLNAAIDLALLMENAYNFETGRDVHKIRIDYSQNALSGLLAGQYLLQDIESFEYDRAVNIRQKEVPIQYTVSMSSSHPTALFDFQDTDTLRFSTTLEEISRSYPGAYNCRIKNVNVIIEGLLPPTGVHGTLSNGCYSVIRLPMPGVVEERLVRYNVTDERYLPESERWRVHGTYYDTVRTQEVESLILSNYSITEDRILFAPASEQLGIFENTGVATDWALHIPRSTNNFDLKTISDVKFVITFSAQYDQDLATREHTEYVTYRNAHPDSFATMAMFSSRYQYPDAFYHFTNADDPDAEFAELVVDINEYAFPRNETDFQINDVSIVFFPPDSLGNNTIETRVILQQSGNQYETKGETDKDQNGILTLENNDLTSKSPFGRWSIKIPVEENDRWKVNSLHDVWLCFYYTSKLKTP